MSVSYDGRSRTCSSECGECFQRSNVFGACDNFQIIVAGAINPEIRLRVICELEQSFAVPERDHFVLAAMNYQQWTADLLDLINVAKLIERKDAIAGHDAKC